MKKFFKGLFTFIGVCYFVLAVFAIVCLLKTNAYGVPQFGNTSLLIISDDSEESEYYEKGDLIIVSRPDFDEIKVGDYVLFYSDTSKHPAVISIDEVKGKEDVNETETTFEIAEYESLSGTRILGKASGNITYHYLGNVLNTLTSQWGFLFLVILPLLIAFLAEIVAIYKEVKEAMKEE